MAVNRINPIVELFFDDQFNDISNRVRGGKTRGFGVDINRGRSDESSTVDPTSLRLTINNQDGRFSPRNPSSDLFEKIGRNTPLRTFVGTKHLGAAAFDISSSTSHVAPSVTTTKSGLLISAWMGANQADTYTVPASMTLGQDTAELNGRVASAYELVPSGATGTRTATVSDPRPQGTASVVLHGDSVVVEETFGDAVQDAADTEIILTTSPTTQRGWWLVAIQTWDYAPEDQSRFFPDAPQDSNGGWILLADTEVIPVSFSNNMHMKVWARRVDNSGEQQVTFTKMPTENNAMNAHLYVLSGVDDWKIRATVEVSEWPPRWDQYGKAVWIPIQGAGILRRLGQGTKPLHSAIRRVLTGTLMQTLQVQIPTGPVAYWPMEDVAGSTQVASGLVDGAPMTLSDDPRFAEFAGRTEVPAGSLPLPDMQQGGSNFTGPVSGTGDLTQWAVSILASFETTSNWPILNINMDGGPFPRIQLQLRESLLRLLGFDEDDNSILIGDLTETLSDGEWYWIELSLSFSGGNVTYQGSAYTEDNIPVFENDTFGTVAGTETGSAVRAKVQEHSAGISASAGHLAFWPTGEPEPRELAREAINGYFNETAGRRIERLCDEEMILFHPVGDLDETTFMGPQRPLTLMTLFRECETADVGILYEPKEVLGLAYRTRRSMFNQQATLAIDYEACHLGHPLEPTDDDQLIRNDITVDRVEGSSVNLVEETGPVSVQPPPDGVGTYDESVTVNIASDLQLPDQASWRLHLGTVDEARYPLVRVKNLAPPHCPLDPDVADDAAALDLGDRLTIDNLPLWLPPDQVQALVQGYTEHLDWYEWDLRLNTSPASPFTIGTRLDTDDTPGPADAVRRDTAGSVIASGLLLDGTAGNFASTPDTGVLDITGDLRITADITPDQWASGTNQNIAAKYVTTGNQRSYRLLINGSGFPQLGWTTDGVSGPNAVADVLPPFALFPRLTIRAQLDVDTGSGWSVGFYWATSPTGSFTQFDVVTGSPATSVFAGTAPLEIGSVNEGALELFSGTVHSVQVEDGIDGTVVANPDFAAQPHGTTSFTDAAGRLWTVQGSAEILGAQFVAGTDTSFEVQTTQGPLWGVTGASNMHFPFDVYISGARVRVTAIGAAVGQVQTFTCEQAVVNGVNKTIPAGTSVRLWQPAVRGL